MTDDAKAGQEQKEKTTVEEVSSKKVIKEKAPGETESASEDSSEVENENADKEE